MSKLKLQAPNAASLKQTGIFGGSAGAGFLISRAGHNFLPDISAPTVRNKAIVAGVILGSLALHASVKGSGDAATLVKGLSAGVAVHNIGKLANMFGQQIPSTTTSGGVNGLRAPAVAKAFLCEHHPMRGLRGGSALRNILESSTIADYDEPGVNSGTLLGTHPESSMADQLVA